MRAAPLLLLLALLAPPLAADQTDPRLQALFARLQATSDQTEAAAVQQDIWERWFDYQGQDPQAADALVRGNAAMLTGQPALAVIYFTALTTRAPNFAEGWNRLAFARFLVGDYHTAAADVERALALEPRHFAALSGLGEIWEQLDKPEQALKAYQRALAINPHMPHARERVRVLQQALRGRAI